jgi:outer membrane receptor protein involved in Fe transport
VLPAHWSLFTTWAQSFRPALLDEAFSRGGWGACNNLNLLRASDGYVPGYARTARVAPSTGLCSSHYQPERSRSVQAGTHVQWPEALGPGTRWVAKLTAFNDHTAQLLESLMAEPGGSGRLIQPGHEHRWGLELESSLDLGAHSLRLSAHRMEGRTFNGLSEHPLLTVPADRLHLAWHHRLGWGEVGLRWQQVWARRYFTDNTLRSTARQPSHRLIGMNLSWRATHWLNVDLAADNLANTPHQLDNGQGGPGTQGPGRQLRLALSARY